MDREGLVYAMELEIRHAVKLLKASNSIERNRRGWIDRFDLLPCARGPLYADYLRGRFFTGSAA